MLVVLQASLQQQAETSLLSASRKWNQDMHTDTAYIQVAAHRLTVCCGYNIMPYDLEHQLAEPNAGASLGGICQEG